MTGPLLETKLYAPRLRSAVVARPRLIDRLDPDTRLTLIAAPAGFGKTTLLAQWLAATAAQNRVVAWLSLDESDQPTVTFWTYFFASVQSAIPGLKDVALSMLQSGQAPIRTVLTTLLNELAATQQHLDVVLDDYHLVDGPELAQGMQFLLEHLPPHVHLVISTRTDPLLPLARLRARGELVEIRAADLRFTVLETESYFHDVAGLNLEGKHVAALEERTEGWIAALQLAGLSMRGRADVAGFIDGFAGDDRYIADYLVEEVLQRQTPNVRSFLLRTCVLELLSGPLCDAVTGRVDGRSTLQSMERENLFVSPLDGNRQWYRYHHLFAEMLRTHLHHELPDEVAELHRSASSWFDRNDQPRAAVRHALAAGEVDRAADLIESAIPDLRQNRQEHIIRGWLNVIPDYVVRSRPVLAAGFIGALMAGNEFDEVEDRLQDVERWLPQPGGRHPDSGNQNTMVVVNQKEFARLPGAIQMYRAAMGLVRGDVAATLRHAEQAKDLAAPDDHVVQAGASALSGLALWTGGDLEAAHQAYSVGISGLLRGGHLSDVLGCSITLADIRITQGRLSDAAQTYEHALEIAGKPEPALRGTADMYVGLAQIACERGDLDTATELLTHSSSLGEQSGLPQNPYRWRLAMAAVQGSRGDLAGAMALIEEAQEVYVGDFSPNVRPIPALRARLLAAQGRVDEAIAWARERNLSVNDNLSYGTEFEHITLVRVLLAQGRANRTALAAEVIDLLERLLAAAEDGGRTGSLIEILVLQALAFQNDGDSAAALKSLERTLRLAESERYVGVFTIGGTQLHPLLAELSRRRARWPYLERVMAACPSAEPVGRKSVTAVTLSDREIDVLGLLATDLSGPEIARQLFISVNTMRSHTKSIYQKLGVNSRRAAVRKGQQRGENTS